MELADGFCRLSSRKIDEIFRALWRNDDSRAYATALGVLRGEHLWMEGLLERIDDKSAEEALAAP